MDGRPDRAVLVPAPVAVHARPAENAVSRNRRRVSPRGIAWAWGLTLARSRATRLRSSQLSSFLDSSMSPKARSLSASAIRPSPRHCRRYRAACRTNTSSRRTVSSIRPAFTHRRRRDGASERYVVRTMAACAASRRARTHTTPPTARSFAATPCRLCRCPAHRRPNRAVSTAGWLTRATSCRARMRATSSRRDMSVPEAPTIQLGPGRLFLSGPRRLENVQTIVQPVLGWNAFNDSRWTIASWNCCLGGETWHSAPVAVEAGVTMEGRVRSSNCTANICDGLVDPDARSRQRSRHDAQHERLRAGVRLGVRRGARGVRHLAMRRASGERHRGVQSDRRRPDLRPVSSIPVVQPNWTLTVVASTPDCAIRGHAASATVLAANHDRLLGAPHGSFTEGCRAGCW